MAPPACGPMRPLDIINLFLFLFLMLGLGSSLDFNLVRDHLSAKMKGVGIGMCVQFIVLPLLCWTCTQIFPMSAEDAIALIVIGSCPGGALSNVLAYIFQMDLALSLVMTTCSSIAAIIMLFLNTYLYGTVLSGGRKVHVSICGMIISAAVVVAGTLLGVWVGKKYIALSLYTEKLGGICGLAIIIISFVVNSQSKAPTWGLKPFLYLVIFIPSFAGTVLGIGLGLLVKLPRASCVAIALEAAVQNQVLALTILSLSLPENDDKPKALAVPLVYGVLSFSFAVFFCIVFFKCGWSEATPGLSLLEAWKEYRENRQERADGLLRKSFLQRTAAAKSSLSIHDFTRRSSRISQQSSSNLNQTLVSDKSDDNFL